MSKKSAAEPKTSKKTTAKKKAAPAVPERGKPGPKLKPKSELARNCVAVHLNDAEIKALRLVAKDGAAKVGAAARDMVVKSLKARKLL